MKSGILGIAIVLFLAAGCKKTTATADRDKFIGTWHMRDSIYSFSYNGQVYTYDTTSYTYDMLVVPVPGTADKVAFQNVATCGACLDTASILSSIASFSPGSTVATAVLTGNKIRLEGGEFYSGSGTNGGRNGFGIGTK